MRVTVGFEPVDSANIGSDGDLSCSVEALVNRAAIEAQWSSGGISGEAIAGLQLIARIALIGRNLTAGGIKQQTPDSVVLELGA